MKRLLKGVFGRRSFSCAAFVLLQGVAFGGTTWCVAPQGNDSANGTSWDAPLKTIQEAVSRAASSGDTVSVSNGTYLLDSPIVVPADKQLSITSYAQDCDSVIIDGQSKTYCIAFLKAAANSLTYVTVRNGVGSAYVPGKTYYYPGGVYIAGGTASHVKILDCHTRVDAGTDLPVCQGGGYCQENGIASALTVLNCSIEVTTTSTAESVPECRGGGVFTTGQISGSLISNCSVVVTAPNLAAGSTNWKVSGGGVYSGAGSTHSRLRVIGTKAILDSPNYSSGTGGGVYLMGTNDKLVDSLVTGCVASREGGGVSVRASGSVLNSVISNNTVAVRCEAEEGRGGGAGVMLDPHYVGAKTVEGCTIVGNVLTNTAGKTDWCDCGGGGVMIAGGSTAYPNVIRDCVIRDNGCWCYGGGIYFYAGSGENATLVTNCWFSGNRASNRGGFAYVTVSAGALVTDCRIDGHSAGYCFGKTSRGDGQFLVRHSDGGLTDNDFTLRNCFVTGNDPDGEGGQLFWFYKGSAGNSPVTFESCTFAGNGGTSVQSGSVLISLSGGAKVAANFTCRGCVFADNPTYDYLFADAMVVEPYTNTFTCSYTDTIGGLVQTGNEVRQNLWPAIAPAPGFADQANGDWRLADGSPLIDTAGEAQDWMGTGTRKGGVRDMGDGTFVVSRATDTTWGVTLARKKAQPRLWRNRPDMGCFECCYRVGFVLMFK